MSLSEQFFFFSKIFVTFRMAGHPYVTGCNGIHVQKSFLNSSLLMFHSIPLRRISVFLVSNSRAMEQAFPFCTWTLNLFLSPSLAWLSLFFWVGIMQPFSAFHFSFSLANREFYKMGCFSIFLYKKIMLLMHEIIIFFWRYIDCHGL